MALYGEIDPANCSTDLSGRLIVEDPGSDRFFFVPSMIVAGDEKGVPLDGNFNFDPATGNAVEQSCEVTNTVLGNRTVVAANVALENSTLGDDVMIRDRVRVYSSKVKDGAVVGRKVSVIGSVIGRDVNIGSRCELKGNVVEDFVRLYPRQKFTPRATITLDTIQTVPRGSTNPSPRVLVSRRQTQEHLANEA